MSDPYEHGFEVAQRRRLHLPPESLTPPGRKRWQRPGRMGWQALVIALGVVVLLAVGRAVTARDATGLKANCSRMQLAVAEKTVKSRGPTLLHWAATAPRGTPFAVSLQADDHSGLAQRTPLQMMGKGCLAHGEFGVLMPPGNYTVILVRLDGAVAQQVAARAVTVTAS